MFEFHIDLLPVLESAVRDLKAATGEETEKLLRNLAIDAPEEMRDMMDSASRSGSKATRPTGGAFTRSAGGEVPAKDSFDLYDSMRGQMTGKNELTLYFAEHAKYLDPVIGGADAYLNRPFVEKALETAVKKLEKA
jgi:hypothetical protein